LNRRGEVEGAVIITVIEVEGGEVGVGGVMAVIMTAMVILMEGRPAIVENHIVEDLHQVPRTSNIRRPPTHINVPQRIRGKATNRLRRILTIYDHLVNNHSLTVVTMQALQHRHMVVVITRLQGAVEGPLLEVGDMEHTDQEDTEVASEILPEDMDIKADMVGRRRQLMLGILVEEVIMGGTTGEGTQQAPLLTARDSSLMEI